MIDQNLTSLVSATTALVASITGPAVTLYMGRAQIRASVLSGNRQKWMDNFRDAIAAFCSQVAVVVQVRDQIIKGGHVNLNGESAMLHEFEQLIFTLTKIKLMANTNRESHKFLLDAMQQLLRSVKSAPNLADINTETDLAVERIVSMSQAILREEWLRVKSGA